MLGKFLSLAKFIISTIIHYVKFEVVVYWALYLLLFQLDPKDIDAWHEEVELFKVQDSESNDIMGYFYLDLHPRDGKFGHAAVFPLQPGCIGPDGTMQVSLCAMMANFSKVSFMIHFLNKWHYRIIFLLNWLSMPKWNTILLKL